MDLKIEVLSSLVMGPGQKILTRVGSIFCGSGWVGSAIKGCGLNLENFPKKRQFFTLRVKKNLLRSGRRRVSLLFTAGQK